MILKRINQIMNEEFDSIKNDIIIEEKGSEINKLNIKTEDLYNNNNSKKE